LEDDIISWLESGGEEIETLERVDKGKDRKIVKEEYDNEWSKIDIKDRGNEIEGIEEEIGTLVSSVWFTGVEKE